MKTCKKLFSLLLVAVMLVAAMPVFAFADATISELYIKVDGGQATKYPISYSTSVTGRQEYNSAADAATPASNLLTAANLTMATDFAGKEIVAAVIDADTGKASITMQTIPTPTHQHSYDPANVVAGSGNAQGHELRCSDSTCNETIRVSHTDAEMHVENFAPATCTAEGYTGDKVYACGYTEPGTKTAKIAHTFDTKGECTCGAIQYTINLTTNGKAETKTLVVEANDTTKNMSTYEGVMAALGMDPSAYNLSGAFVKSDATITFAITPKPSASVTYSKITVKINNDSTSTAKSFVYEGEVKAANAAAILQAAGITNVDLSKYNVTSATAANGEITLVLTDANKYTVNCIVNGTQFSSKTGVAYSGTINSENAQAILNAAKIEKTVSNYKRVTVTSNNGVITVNLCDTVTVRIYNNATSYSEVTMDVGQPYVNYLGTNIINNSTFGGITVKRNTGFSEFFTASKVTGGTAIVNGNETEITIQRSGDSCTLNFLRSDGTVLESRKLYAGDQIGTLPSYTVGGVPATWTYNGKPISATDVYNFKTTSVNIVPYFGGISDVYVDVYINGNVKTMQTRVKVTDLVQNGVLYLNSDVKSAISSALRNSSNKNLTYTAFFDASTWSDFIKNKNTSGAAEPYRVGDNSERQGAVYLYVMVNNATVKATDSTNPKTGDNVKLGAAAAILAVAVVGFGAVVVINKKKGVR